MGSKGLISKVPDKFVDVENAKLAELEAQIAVITEQMEQLKAL
ncbi:hypothetical protein [Psychrobacter alimentarius]